MRFELHYRRKYTNVTRIKDEVSEFRNELDIYSPPNESLHISLPYFLYFKPKVPKLVISVYTREKNIDRSDRMPVRICRKPICAFYKPCTYKIFIHVYICTGVLESKFSNISSNDFRSFVFLVLKRKKDRILNERKQ